MRHFFVFALIATLIGCGGVKDITKFNRSEAVLSMHKAPCQGKCSVYNLDIYKNGYVVYEGISNVEKYGLYYKILSKKELLSLTNEFDSANFFNFKDNYPVPSADLPAIALSYRQNKIAKTVVGSIDRPKELLDLQRTLEKLAKSDGFKLFKQYEVSQTSDDVLKDVVTQSEYIEDQFIVELQPNVFMAEWLRKYQQYDVRLVKKLSPDLNYWVISFSKIKIEPSNLLAVFKNDPQLKFVEQNKRVQSRSH
ncbi:MAG: DUF6438 domain-containing protein [Saprospiraceae bacterium]|jgi:hypothetical protein